MSMSRHQSEIDQIERIADAKGIELDDIEVTESTSDDGDKIITFRIMETKGETETDSVGIQVSKMPSLDTSDMTFRSDLQSKMSSLKRHLSDESVEVDESPSDSTESDDGSVTDDAQSSRTRTRTRSTDGPGSSIDASIADLEARMDDVEDRLDTIEEKAEALDGLQQLMNGGSDE